MAAPTIKALVADWFLGYTRILCPHCPLSVRFRGVDAAEEKWLRTMMVDHITGHRQTA
ncbi:hypothetical protein [Streptomyces violascens]|uniref:Uncharacterized protein n=1 Tax=Streptomyces violascens TaxID=67381 RepID=A0ABQ3QQZ1_9ACTN|nr:hypothetical protein [Streptomyces violascens]GGU52735.1 hypothetical protein GCM10010289_86110 [Streptomyces violascens]GHI39704.1 hypothetical protein Sviol_41120 [Streptomyces violascens]